MSQDTQPNRDRIGQVAPYPFEPALRATGLQPRLEGDRAGRGARRADRDRCAGIPDATRPRDAGAQLQAWIERAAEKIGRHDRNGPIAGRGPVAGHDRQPGREAMREARKVYREALARLCRQAGLSQPETAATMLVLLGEGAEARRQSEGPGVARAQFLQAARATLATFG